MGFLIRVGEGDGADRGGKRTSRGAGHRLDANKMVRDRARIGPFLQVFSGSRILPFIERLDEKIENPGRVSAGGYCPRHGESDLKFSVCFPRHLVPRKL